MPETSYGISVAASYSLPVEPGDGMPVAYQSTTTSALTRDHSGPIAISIRRISSGAAERIFAYSGIGDAVTVRRVFALAWRLAAGSCGVCEIEIIRPLGPHRTGLHGIRKRC